MVGPLSARTTSGREAAVEERIRAGRRIGKVEATGTRRPEPPRLDYGSAGAACGSWATSATPVARAARDPAAATSRRPTVRASTSLSRGETPRSRSEALWTRSGLAANSSMAAASNTSRRFYACTMSRSSRQRAQRKSASSRLRYAHVREPPSATSAAHRRLQDFARRILQRSHNFAYSPSALREAGRGQPGRGSRRPRHRRPETEGRECAPGRDRGQDPAR